ncbi:MAG: 4Fe-4S dicluster domain-containing protein, partial [Clostridia bacterium]|nr:4Fe-4S dicluster domain-containing protein [Clostridia bacterium]
EETPALSEPALFKVCCEDENGIFKEEQNGEQNKSNDSKSEAESVLRNVNGEASPASFAIRFAASLPGVRTVLSGMSSAEQVKDNAAYMERFVPLSDSEKEAVFRVADIIKGVPAIPCTGCSYCTEGCPMHIAIPQYFSLFNAEKRTNGIPDKASVKTDFSDLEKESGKPGDCIGCGQCVAVCPQKLDIPALLQKVNGHFHPQK